MTKEQEIVIFYYRLGVAISEWALVENWLRVILVAMFDDNQLNHESLSVGVFSLEGFRAKLQFVNGVVSRKLTGSPHIKEWSELVERASNVSAKRNKLAHWPVQKYWQCRAGRRIALVPWISPKTTRKTKVPRPPAGSLCIRDIIKLGMDFIALAVALENFLHRAYGLKAPHPKSDEQSGNPPTVENLGRQIREAFSRQLQSSDAKP